MTGLILFICLALQTVGTYIIWPSRYNISNHMSLGFIFVAYFVPLIVLNNFSKDFSESIIVLYTIITVLGTVFYVAGLLIGQYLPLIKIRYLFHFMPQDVYATKAIKLTKRLVLVGVIGMIISFAVMGFIPAFASDPSSARFFKGPYHDSYIRIAVLYRFSFFLLVTMMPIIIIIWYQERKFSNILLVILPIVMLTLTLSRTAAFSGVLFGIALICAYRSRILIFLFSLALIVIYGLGSMSFYLVGIIFDIEALKNIVPGENIWELIAAGSPDINDQLNFLTIFNSNSVYTYGRTMFGGLVPGNYKWNPANYTLSVLSPGADVTEIASGGLRLSLPMWGYVSFSWPGVIIYSLLSGILTAYCISYIKAWIKDADLIKITIIVLLVSAISAPISNFYILSMYSVPEILIMLLYCYQIKIK